jgi:hypothetical protein
VASPLLDRILQLLRSRQVEKVVARAQGLARHPRTQTYLHTAKTKAEEIAQDPRVQRTVTKAQDRLQAAASDPRTQAKIRAIVAKLHKR